MSSEATFDLTDTIELLLGAREEAFRYEHAVRLFQISWQSAEQGFWRPDVSWSAFRPESSGGLLGFGPRERSKMPWPVPPTSSFMMPFCPHMADGQRLSPRQTLPNSSAKWTAA